MSAANDLDRLAGRRGTADHFEQRGAPVGLILQSLRPKGDSEESLAGKKAHPPSGTVKQLTDFVETAMKKLTSPERGLRSSTTGRSCSPAASACASSASRSRWTATRCSWSASNTKALTTLLLAKLVDDGKLNWDTR